MRAIRLNNIDAYSFYDVPCHVFSKDLRGRYLSCNQRMACDLNLTDSNDIVGVSDNELVWKSYSAVLQGNDEQTLCQRDLGCYVEPAILPGQLRVCLKSYKFPLVNFNGQVTGVFGVSVVDDCERPSMCLLTDRQIQICEYLTQGYTAKEVAHHLCISQRTVELHILRAVQCLRCRNRPQLIYLYSFFKLLGLIGPALRPYRGKIVASFL